MIKDAVKKLAEAFGYRIQRIPGNRFQAMRDTLKMLSARGYAPSMVIDGGANMGQWTSLAGPIFPDAVFHLIEPQPACEAALAAVTRDRPRMIVHRLAITAPGVSSVVILGGAHEVGSSGAYVALPEESGADAMQCPAATLDALFAHVAPEHGVMLKLDLEGHELEALRGAVELLKKVEVVLSEVRFYDINHGGRPVFRQLLMFLSDHGFELYDIAALTARPKDKRLALGDVVFVRRDSALRADSSFE